MIVANLFVGAPQWLLPACVLAAVVLMLVGWSYFRASASPGVRTVAALLKGLGIAALAVCLVEPLFSGVRPRPGANVFVVLADNSQSMNTQSDGRSRSEQLQRVLAQDAPWQTRLQQDFDVRDYAFAAQLDNVAEFGSLKFDGTTSALSNALQTVASRFRQRPVAGLLLLTDGNATDVDGNPDWSELGFPVYPVVGDTADSPRDIGIRQVNVSQTNFETSPMSVNVSADCHGYVGQSIVARVVDQQQNVLAEGTAMVKSADEPVEFQFRFRPEQPGLSFARIEIFAEADRGRFEKKEVGKEVTLANNTRVITVDRGGGPYRVLYVAGRPNWEFKFLRRALQEDDEINLVGLLRIARKEPKFSFRDQGGVSSRNPLFQGFDNKDDDEAEAYDQPVLLRLGIDPANEDELRDGFPKSADELFPYHAIILDDIEAGYFSPDQMLLIRRFVSQRGGGLLMAGGQETFLKGRYNKTPIGELLPVYLNQPDDEVQSEEYRLQLTREGWLQNWTRVRSTEAAENQRLNEMTHFRTLNPVSDVKPGASVLAEVETPGGETRPALVTQRFGKGRSAALLIGDMWRWAMHQKESDQQDLQQSWRQVMRWLVSDVPRRVEVKTRTPKGQVGPVSVDVFVRDEQYQAQDNVEVALTVTTPAGEQIEMTAEPSERVAGLYSVDFWPREEGGYRASAKVTTADGQELDPREAGWTSQPAAEEFRNLSTNRDFLADLAKQTGGELVHPRDLQKFVDGLPNRKIPVTEQWVYPIWHQPWVLLFAISCLCGEWGLRRWKGLP